MVASRDIYTVSRLNREARGILETGLPSLWITGELSNLSRPASGHWYFTLKDEDAQVRCAMFRQRNLAVRTAPRDGLQVLLRSRVGLYEARGEFQLVVDHLEEAGEGELRRRFEALKLKLAAEGLFDEARKRAPPRFPRRVGVVTSATGAALRDVLHVLRRRFPAIPVLLYPVPVQGAGAAREIAAMLALADGRAEVDVLLLVRGGGSLEDLWAFNDEGLARAIAGLGLPLITGVGHEVDFTIADFVADLRAPTPSAAAELAVPDAAGWRDAVRSTAMRLQAAAERSLGRRGDAMRDAARRLERLHPAQAVRERMQRLDELQSRALAAMRREGRSRGERLLRLAAELGAASPAPRLAALRQRTLHAAIRLAPCLGHGLALARGRLQAALQTLHATSPLATLGRGYAIVTRAADGAVLRDPAGAPPGTDIDARLALGTLRARVLPGDG
ncbi:MAG TPA: exodeoxyribonuclease VII large subunit [Steroidobacteraceae bacterium]|nr:exodeoxyribonuclease VII large subunit [Steroidobacteraceae bacterium]